MGAIRFAAKIEIHQANPYVLVSAERAKLIKDGWHKPLPVRIQINGQPDEPWRINMMPIGDGSFYLYLHGDVRKASGTKVGDTVQVDVAFDDAYRPGPTHPMPDWFRAALEKNPKAKQAWDKLIPSRQKEILRYFFGLKTEAARARNMEKVIRVLSGGSERFMARSWKNGS